MPALTIPSGLQTRLCLLGDNIFPELAPSLKQFWPDREYCIVADENTWLAAGEKADCVLKAAGLLAALPVIFPAEPQLHADYQHVSKLLSQLRGKAVLAVGSGTINDLVKRASFEAETGGYLCLATAPSVDGYTSAGAALTVNGFKCTMPCPAPLVILADNSVIGSAPMEMIAAGYADLAAKVVAGADWHIAAALGQAPLDATAWSLVQQDLRLWLAAPEKLKAREPLALQRLFTGLANTGFAMQHMQDSRPASGAEHLFSHIWEMRGIHYQGKEPSHGFKVAIGTLLSSALMLEIFQLPMEEIQRRSKAQALITSEERRMQVEKQLQGTAFLQPTLKIAMNKFLCGEALQERRREIFRVWPELAAKVLAQLLPFSELKQRFQCLGCPVEPEEIGLHRAELVDGVLAAAMIRQRYTILDLLFELGLLKPILEEVLRKDYFHFS